MEVFLERLLLELVAIAVQLAIVKVIAWMRQRIQVSDSQPQTGWRLAVA
jgi:hypothetical protein